MSEISPIELVETLNATTKNINMLAKYFGFAINQVESIQETFDKDTIFTYQRPEELEGIFAYVTTQENLSKKTRANQFKTFFLQASQAMTEKGETSSEVDFIIVIGKSVLIIFDSADYRKRLVLTTEKLSRENSKYLVKLESLKAENIKEKYKEDEDFGDIFLADEFKTDLFRFAISDDINFSLRTRKLRGSILAYIEENKKAKSIIESYFFNNENTDLEEFSKVIYSSVTDTLVLRQIFMRVLEGKFGYEEQDAKAIIKDIGLGTTLLDSTLDKALKVNVSQDRNIASAGDMQLDLFELSGVIVSDKTVLSGVQNSVSQFIKETYGGDLYVGDVAQAATEIEATFTPTMFGREWSYLSSNSFDFDLADVTPNTIGEQYEQTMTNELAKNPEGKFVYKRNNSEQKEKGSFYTSQKITDYIVSISLGEKLKEIRKEMINEKSEKKRRILLKSVLDLKIADISSGGGTFLASSVRYLGEWYNSLKNYSELIDILPTIKPFNDLFDFQKYMVENAIYGVDVDLKALIVSSFALNLESLGDKVQKLPVLLGKTLIHQNSLISLVPNDKRKSWFEVHKPKIVELLKERKLFLKNKKNSFEENRRALQKIFMGQAAEYLATKKFPKEKLLLEFQRKYMEVLELNIPEVFFDTQGELGKGFDVVFGNPPYISTKGQENIEKYIRKSEYGFQDDAYNHFFFRSIQLLKENGYLGYITSKTYWTIQTKRNLRDLLLSKSIKVIWDTGYAFDSAMVDTAVISLKNCTPDDNTIKFRELGEDIFNPNEYEVKQSVYLNTQNSVIFTPNENNMKIWEHYGKKVKALYDTWWDKISTSKNIEKNKAELELYRQNLKPGDITLLGCLTEGGQGLATANNGKYIAIRKSTKWAKNTLESRPKKLQAAINNHNIEIEELKNFHSAKDFLENLSEIEIASLFDSLKERFGRDIFGQGYIYRLIDDDEIADVTTLTEEEKKNGISPNKKFYVPYDKGDKDGNRWYLETPFAIAWTTKNVRFLKADSRARYQGHMYYFKEGFCWTDVNSTYLKARLKNIGVFDVLSMSLFSKVKLEDWYFVTLINSRFISLYVDNFINSTSHFQINDARQLPIVIPNQEQLKDFHILFAQAIATKTGENTLLTDERIQDELDAMVEKLYLE